MAAKDDEPSWETDAPLAATLEVEEELELSAVEEADSELDLDEEDEGSAVAEDPELLDVSDPLDFLPVESVAVEEEEAD